MKKKTGNLKRRKATDRKKRLKKSLTVYYAINAVVTAVFVLYMGISVAGRYTERNLSGNFPDLIYIEDIKSSVTDFLSRYTDFRF